MVSVGIHGVLLGLDTGIQQNHPALSPARHVTFRLVARQIDPSPEPLQKRVERIEPETITRELPLQPESTEKTVPEATKKSRPLSPVTAPVETVRNRKSEEPVVEQEVVEERV